MSTQILCDRCGTELPYARTYADGAVHHERDGQSFSLHVTASIIGHIHDRTDICEPCVRELAKKAFGSCQ